MQTVVFDISAEEMGAYTRVEVWRKDARGLLLLGGPSALPAQTELPSGLALTAKSRTYAVQTLSLPFTLNGTERKVTFSGSAPLSGEEVATQVQSAVADIEVVDGEEGLCFRSRIQGTYAALYFPVSDAAALLELPMQVTLVGRDPLPVLSPSVQRYTALDADGAPDSRYMYRLTDGVSTGPFSTEVRPILPGAAVATMRCRLQRADGGVAAGQRATVFVQPFYSSGGFSPDAAFDLVADANGYVSIRLRKGCFAEITLPGTGLVHKFRVPTDVDLFDPFDSAYSVEDDAFKVRTPDWGDPLAEDL